MSVWEGEAPQEKRRRGEGDDVTSAAMSREAELEKFFQAFLLEEKSDQTQSLLLDLLVFSHFTAFL